MNWRSSADLRASQTEAPQDACRSVPSASVRSGQCQPHSTAAVSQPGSGALGASGSHRAAGESAPGSCSSMVPRACRRCAGGQPKPLVRSSRCAPRDAARCHLFCVLRSAAANAQGVPHSTSASDGTMMKLPQIASMQRSRCCYCTRIDFKAATLW